MALTEWLARAVRPKRIGDAPSADMSKFAANKLESIGSYSDFCRTGKAAAYPLEIFLEISNICDLKCSMCVQFSALNPHRLEQIQSRARGFMNQGEISENLEQVLSHALLVHCFGYGEPTIHPTFRGFLELISQYEVMIDFFTNGMHLDEEFCRFLVDRRVYKITVSFSGSTRETYENIYLGGDFDKVLDGIKCLSDAKKARGSRFPIIEINSLAFRDHVDRFDDFVTLMADHGANVVMLKPLQAYATIPALFEHVSIMRPHVEGKILARAMKIGRRRGIEVNPNLYVERGVADEREYDRQVTELKAEADAAFGKTGGSFGQNPVAQFEALAVDLEPIRNPDTGKRDERVLSLDSPAPLARTLLNVRTGPKETDPFYCMEPFKTLYISRNGGTKSCCFANPGGWQLGDAKSDNALSIWRGMGFEMTRSAIAEGEYPMRNCEVCIHRKSGPQGHFALELLRNYFEWHHRHFGDDLRRSLVARIPDALDLIASKPSVVMARARQEKSAVAVEEGSWPFERKTEEAEEFVSSTSSYLHRDLVPRGIAPLRRPQDARHRVSLELLQFVQSCGQRLYAGSGSIVDLALPPSALESLIAGLGANERIEEFLAAFEMRHEKMVERFDLAVAESDFAGSDKFVRERIGNIANVRWLTSKPIEICLVGAGARAQAFQRAFVSLAQFFMPAQTIVVVDNFYRYTDFQWTVTMGLLSESFEWRGQIANAAVFRYVQPLRPEAAAMSQRDLPADLSLRCHRHWHHERLPLETRLHLDISYGRLLSTTRGIAAASAHFDALETRYRKLLAGDIREWGRCERLLAWARQRWASVSKPVP